MSENGKNGYVGFSGDKREAELERLAIEAAGIPCTIKERRDQYTVGEAYSLYVEPQFVDFAREIRRGFKVAMHINIGEGQGFMTGLKLGIWFRMKGNFDGIPRDEEATLQRRLQTGDDDGAPQVQALPDNSRILAYSTDAGTSEREIDTA